MRSKTYLDGLRFAVKVAETLASGKDNTDLQDGYYYDGCIDVSKVIRKEIIHAAQGDEFQVTRW